MKDPKLIVRLIDEADKGIKSDVSLIEAMEFRREQYGLNQSEFALVLACQKSHYSEFLKGKRNLTLRSRKRAAAIGVPLKSLLSK